MALFDNKYRIESARLASWDYSWPGWYYVTIVVGDRQCAFGEVVSGQVCLSPLGVVAEKCWKEIPQHHHGVELDDYHEVMPNHVHGNIILNDAKDNHELRRGRPKSCAHGRHEPLRDGKCAVRLCFRHQMVGGAPDPMLFGQSLQVTLLKRDSFKRSLRKNGRSLSWFGRSRLR